MEIKKYEQSLAKVSTRMLSKGAISSLKTHFLQNFNNLIREANQIIKISENQTKQYSDDDFNRARALQQEINSDWDKINGKIKDNENHGVEEIDKTNLSKQAASYLHQEFLAIRMIAYKMYEQYTNHTHSDLY